MSFKIKYTDSMFSSHQMYILLYINRHIQNDVVVALHQKVLFYDDCVVKAGWPHTEMQIYDEVASWKEKLDYIPVTQSGLESPSNSLHSSVHQ